MHSLYNIDQMNSQTCLLQDKESNTIPFIDNVTSTSAASDSDSEDSELVDDDKVYFPHQQQQQQQKEKLQPILFWFKEKILKQNIIENDDYYYHELTDGNYVSNSCCVNLTKRVHRFIFAFVFPNGLLQNGTKPYIVDCFKTFEDIDNNQHINHNIDMINVSISEWKPIRCDFMCPYFGQALDTSKVSDNYSNINDNNNGTSKLLFLSNSAVCKAAVDAGVVDSVRGGCALLKKQYMNITLDLKQGVDFVYEFKNIEEQQCVHCYYYND
eukprot:Pgem_evm1s17509